MWKKSLHDGWVDENQKHFVIYERQHLDLSGMKGCPICESLFEESVKAKGTAAREIVEAKLEVHKKHNKEARQEYARNVYDGIATEATCS